MAVTLSNSAEAGAGEQQVILKLVATLDEFEGLFDVLELWRSRSTSGGPFEELTAERYQPARLPSSAQDPPAVLVTGTQVALTGKTLSLRVEGDDIDILFAGVDPLTYANAATQITTLSAGRVASYVDETGVLVVQSVFPGPGSSIEVLESEAAPILGLATEEPDNLDHGNDARMPLVEGQTTYVFIDPLGSSEYFYRARFRNTYTGGVSPFTLTVGPPIALGVSTDNLAIGELDLVTVHGAPLASQEVRIHSQFTGVSVEGKTMVGSDLLLRTDVNGHVEFKLVRGQRVSVAVPGTDLVRDIVVPTDPSIERFNLLDPSVGVGDDVFKVQVPTVVYAERRSL